MVPSGEVSDPHVERFRGYLCLLARAHLRPGLKPQLEASDIVQQTLLEAYEQRGEFCGSSDEQLAQWLKRMLIHNLTDAIRQLECAKRDVRRERSLEARIDDSISRADGWLAANHSSPSQRAIHIEQVLRVAEVLTRLPDDQREAVVLHYLQGWSLGQIAEHLRRSESAVAGLLHRGLKKLRTLMSAEVSP